MIETPRPILRRSGSTVGFLTANIHLGASGELWNGVIDAAREQGVNVLCFPGGVLGSTGSSEAQRNVLYNLVGGAGLQGIVSWSSTITGSLAAEDVIAFHQRFQPLPFVSLTQTVRGVPTLSVDSYQGMRAAITHLIEVHGYRRLAFIRGPASHFYAAERFRAYRDILHEHDIPYLPSLVTPPLHWEAGVEAVHCLFDQVGLRPGIDVEAIVAVSDLLALGALKALQARGIRVPHELAMVGFNDSAEGRIASPPLTSVAMPLYEQGARAVETLLAHNGDTAPPHIVLESRLVVRQSCGCLSSAVTRAARMSEDAPLLSDDVADQHTALAEAIAEVWVDRTAANRRARTLLAAFQTDLRNEHSYRFLGAIERLLDETATSGGDVGAWQNVLSALRQQLLPGLDAAKQVRAEDLIGQARILVGEVALRTQASRQLQAERQLGLLRDIGQALITSFDVATLNDVLVERLPKLGIASCYLVLYNRPAETLDDLRLVLAFTERGRIALPPDGRMFSAAQLLPPDLLPDYRQYSYVIEPLSFHEQQIGYILFEIGPREGALYETLRGYISSALKGALLMGEAHQARLVAEKADQIKTRLLANVSHELRTPLHIILDQTRRAAESTGASQPELLHIQSSAEHQLRLINDLLDISRAEINELDLYPELLDPRPLLIEAFESLTARADSRPDVCWSLELPARLPLIYADPVRLRQVLLNLLSNAAKFTTRGRIVLGAEVAPPHLHLWVEDTGSGIPADMHDRIFEPFVTAEQPARHTGIGLGLSITRQLVALHQGTIRVESDAGNGSVFHIFLPLPSLHEQAAAASHDTQPVLLVISSAEQVVPELAAFSQRRQVAVQYLHPGDDLERVLSNAQPIAIGWDVIDARPGDWALARRLHNHPRWGTLPFIVYGHAPSAHAAAPLGMTSYIAKPTSAEQLLETIGACGPAQTSGPILVVDDEPESRQRIMALIAQALPGYDCRPATNGSEALAAMAETVPSLVVLDLVMPGIDGADVLDQMRADERLCTVPVVILSSKLLGLDDIKRLEQHTNVLLHSKGLLSDEEMAAALHRALFDDDNLPPQTGALVKRAVAYLHQNYSRELSRWELAQSVGVSEDYLSRVFNREIGLSPWEYLNRYRIVHAKARLLQTSESVSAIAQSVGFHDRGYFSRVFRKIAGVGPQEFRDRRGL